MHSEYSFLNSYVHGEMQTNFCVKIFSCPFYVQTAFLFLSFIQDKSHAIHPETDAYNYQRQ